MQRHLLASLLLLTALVGADPVTGVTVPLRAGWNPLAFQCQQVTSLSAPGLAGVARWTGTAYEVSSPTQLNGRQAYWAFASAPTNITYSGVDDGQGAFVDLPFNGYNLVSFSTSRDIPLNTVTATRSGQAATIPLLFEIGPDLSYTQVTDAVRPGRAYWAFSTAANVRLTWTGSGPVATSLVLTPPNATVSRFSTSSFSVRADGQDVTANATYEAAEPSIASPLGGGVFKGLNPGTTRVTARYGGLTASSNLTVTDQGVPGPGPSPSPVARIFYALGGANELAILRQSDVGLVSSAPVTGSAAYTLVSLAYRPSTGVLYALGFNFAAVGQEGRLYTIDPATRVATQVGAGFPMPTAIGSTLNAVASFGMAFDPVSDTIRVTSSGRDNFRLSPTGSLTADTIITPAFSTAVGLAYTPGSTSTTAYVIDATADTLCVLGGNPVPPGASPDGGVLTTVGPLGFDTNTDTGLTINSSGTAFATLTVGGTSALYAVNLATGAATLTSGLPPTLTVRSLEAAP